ncbi:MAG: TfoX/Sxy family protein [Hyphomonas sp.]|nr:TfoX/Sxy family protein [Hyphomonas sp.]
MAVDEETAGRLRGALAGLEGLSEKRMMGGLCFFLNGNMVGGADRPKTGAPRFMFRVGKDNEAAGNALPGAEPLVQGGRAMRGFFFVDEAGCDDEALGQWVSLAVSHAAGLPPK